MVRAAPLVSFTVTSIDYGTIDVGASSARRYYDIYLHGESTTYTEAINMSISFKELSNASEARSEEWVKVSTHVQDWTTIGSVSTGTEAFASTVIAGTREPAGSGPGLSLHVATVISVPSGAATAGAVTFYLHHRLRAVIRRVGGSISTLVTMTTRPLNWIAGLQLSLAPFFPLIVY